MTDTVKSGELSAIGSSRTGAARSRSARPSPNSYGTRHPGHWPRCSPAASIARVLNGDWQLSDAILPVVLVATFPLYEWVIHVFVLHWKPRRIGPLTLDSILARDHRRAPRRPARHSTDLHPVAGAVLDRSVDRRDLGLRIPPPRARADLPGHGERGRARLRVGALPRPHRLPPASRGLYRAVWNNHRLHHYKNEHYWFTVTSSGTADRLFGTYPDAASVPRSETARNLHALPTSRAVRHAVAVTLDPGSRTSPPAPATTRASISSRAIPASRSRGVDPLHRAQAAGPTGHRFDLVHPVRARRPHRGEGHCSPTRAGCDQLLVVGSHGSVRRDGAVGTVSARGVDAAWDLRFDPDPGSCAISRIRGSTALPLPRTKSTSPYPSMRVSGTVTVDGHTVRARRLAGHARAQLGRRARAPLDLAARRVVRARAPTRGSTSSSAGSRSARCSSLDRQRRAQRCAAPGIASAASAAG